MPPYVRPLVGNLQMSAGGRRPPLREMRREFAEKRQGNGASCAGGLCRLELTGENSNEELGMRNEE